MDTPSLERTKNSSIFQILSRWFASWSSVALFHCQPRLSGHICIVSIGVDGLGDCINLQRNEDVLQCSRITCRLYNILAQVPIATAKCISAGPGPLWALLRTNQWDGCNGDHRWKSALHVYYVVEMAAFIIFQYVDKFHFWKYLRFAHHCCLGDIEDRQCFLCSVINNLSAQVPDISSSLASGSTSLLSPFNHRSPVYETGPHYDAISCPSCSNTHCCFERSVLASVWSCRLTKPQQQFQVHGVILPKSHWFVLLL